VYDCFRAGRARVNLPLVREIAQALGASSTQVDELFARCHAPVVAPPVVSDAVDPEAAQPVIEEEKPAQTAASFTQACLLILGCVALNLLGREFEEWLHLPVHLDMVGTAIAAIALGPWWGALAGGATNVLGVAVSGTASLPFALVNIAGALVWGYGVRRYRMGRSLPRFFVLNLVVALVCTVVAVPILTLLYGGSTGHGQDTLTDNFVALSQTALAAVGFSNLLVSVGDKMISGFVALAAVASLPANMRRGVPLAFVSTPAPEGE